METTESRLNVALCRTGFSDQTFEQIVNKNKKNKLEISLVLSSNQEESKLTCKLLPQDNSKCSTCHEETSDCKLTLCEKCEIGSCYKCKKCKQNPKSREELLFEIYSYYCLFNSEGQQTNK